MGVVRAVPDDADNEIAVFIFLQLRRPMRLRFDNIKLDMLFTVDKESSYTIYIFPLDLI